MVRSNLEVSLKAAAAEGLDASIRHQNLLTTQMEIRALDQPGSAIDEWIRIVFVKQGRTVAAHVIILLFAR